MLLPVSRLRPRSAPRRAASSTVPIAAADNAVHASALDQLSPRSKLGGSSSFQARHPFASPRSINLPATIAAPAPTSSQVVRCELFFFRFTLTALGLDGQERQAGCRSNWLLCAFYCY